MVGFQGFDDLRFFNCSGVRGVIRQRGSLLDSMGYMEKGLDRVSVGCRSGVCLGIGVRGVRA